MELNLKNKSVLITGGATGIGKAIALEFLKEGAFVSVCCRTESKLLKFKDECSNLGYDVDIYIADVTKRDEMEKMAAEIYGKHGIDIWINNAGTNIHHLLTDYTKEEYDTIMDTNLYGVYEGSRIAAKYMKEQGRGGVIVNASSWSTIIPHTESALYAASKAAVSSLTRTFAATLAPYGIRTFSYVPGLIVTEFSKGLVEGNLANLTANIAEQRLGIPQDVAKIVVFFCSDSADYVTGCDIEMSGGKYTVQNTKYSWDRL